MSFLNRTPRDVRIYQAAIGLSVVAAWVAIPLGGYGLYMRAGRIEGLRARAASATCDRPCAVGALTEVLALSPGDRNARIGRCLLSAREGRPAEARELKELGGYCEDALALVKANSASSSEIRDVYLARARLFEQAAPRQSVDDLTGALELPTADKTQLLTWRARLRLRLNERDAAKKDAQAAVTANTSSIEGARDVSLEILSEAAAKEAPAIREAAAKEALAILRMRGAERASRAESASAQADFKRILEIEPGDPEALLALGDLALFTNEATQAVGYFEQAAARSPSRHASAGLAHALAQSGSKGPAAKHLARIKLDLSPGAAELQYHLGMASNYLCRSAKSCRKKVVPLLEAFVAHSASTDPRVARARSDLAALQPPPKAARRKHGKHRHRRK